MSIPRGYAPAGGVRGWWSDEEEIGKALALLDCLGGSHAPILRALPRLEGPGQLFDRLIQGRASELFPRTYASPERAGPAHDVVAKLRRYDRDAAVRALNGLGGRVVAAGCDGYPSRAMQLCEPPPLMVVAGCEVPDDKPVVAIVGTRRATATGLCVAERLGYELAEAGVCVVSGLAKGIDTRAHRGSLDAVSLPGAGTPMAVLGSGLAHVYPSDNEGLCREIARTGLVLSPYGLFSRAKKWFFPRRNRLMAAMCDVAVVVESFARGGALSTAAAALELGKEVMAVPGPVTSPASDGTFELIRDGAAPVRGASDVLESLAHMGKAPTPIRRDGAGSPTCPHESEERRSARSDVVLGYLSDGVPRQLSEIATGCAMTVPEVLDVLVALRACGCVKPHGEERFRAEGVRSAR